MSASEPTNNLTCPDCDSSSVAELWKEQQFSYGAGDKAVSLSAWMPVLQCSTCGFQYSDERGETARHEAVCAHLGVLTPKEIVAIREHLNLTRAEFASLLGVGQASLQRWESASLIQSVSLDRLIRLTQTVENVTFLRRLSEKRSPSSADISASSNVIVMVPSDRVCRRILRANTPKHLEAARTWRLRG